MSIWSAHNLPGRLLILVMALASTFLLLEGESEAIRPTITVEHRVAGGDTLWALAETFTSPGEDVRDSIALIKELNQLSSSELRTGQVLVLPAG
jgi:LysM repeat protein